MLASFEDLSAGPLAWGPLDGGSLYFIESGALRFCPVSKCSLGSGSFNTFAAPPFDVTASATGVPICVTVPAPYGEIFCVFDFGTLAEAKSIATSLSPLYIALDATYVYWVDDRDLALERCAFNRPCGANHEVLAHFPDRPGPFVVDGAKIYGIVAGPTGFLYTMTTP
jgi:hypothetical protein